MTGRSSSAAGSASGARAAIVGVACKLGVGTRPSGPLGTSEKEGAAAQTNMDAGAEFDEVFGRCGRIY
eukprot:6568385-Prymnesium_polylepis.1